MIIRPEPYLGTPRLGPIGHVTDPILGPVSSSGGGGGGGSTWTGAGSTNNFSDAGNWNVLPTAGSNLTFSGSTRLFPNNDMAAATSFGNITFANGAGAFWVRGNSITLTGTITNSGSAAQTFDPAIAVAAARIIACTSGPLTLGGVISGAGGITKTGNSLLTLSGVNTYTGATAVNGNSLRLGGPPTAPVAGSARWFDASVAARMALSGSLVTRWDDLSGNAANATPQTGDGFAHEPTYTASSLNGLGAIDFIGSDNVVNSSTKNLLFSIDTSIRTVVMVFKGASFLLTDQASYQFHRPISPTSTDPANPLWDTTYSDTNIQTGTTYVNGAAVNGTTFPMPTGPNNGFNLVALSTAGAVRANGFNRDRTFNSGIQSHAEALIYDTVLSGAQIDAVRSYLNGKWGLGISGLPGIAAAYGAVTVAAGGTLGVGGFGTITAMTSSTLTFTDSTSKLRVETNGTNAVSTVSSGAVALNNATVDFNSAQNLAAGTYTILFGTSMSGTATQGTLPIGRTWTSLMVVANNLVAVLA